jgi:hypothetical protein
MVGKDTPREFKSKGKGDGGELNVKCRIMDGE